MSAQVFGREVVDPYQVVGNALVLLARRLDAHLQAGGGTASSAELRQLRLLTTDALHALGDAADARCPSEGALQPLDRALRHMAEEFRRATGTDVDVRIRGDIRLLPRPTARLVLDTAHEAFTNIGRYARSTFTRLTLVVDDDRLVFEVVDDGVDLAQRQVGAWRSTVELGLHRVGRAFAAEGGGLAVAALEPRGLRLRAVLPVGAKGRS